MKFPNQPQPGQPIAHWAVEVLNYLRASTVVSVSGGLVQQTPNGTNIVLPKNRAAESAGTSGTSGPCSFGTIITTAGETPGKAILGGLIRCGDQNFNVSDQTLSLGTDGVWLVQILLSDIECATDDDGEIFLPGVITSTSTPAWNLKSWTDPTDYDANTNPTGPSSPTGSIVLPIGKLTIAAGVPTLAAVGCGGFVIGQCAGILTYSRS